MSAYEKKPCAVCGAPLPRRRFLYCSDACRTEANRSRDALGRAAHKPPPLPRERVCPDCGKGFMQRGSSVRCPSCQAKRNRAAQIDYLRRESVGHVRRIGSVDLCAACGERYMVESSHQKYCKNCSADATRENRRIKERERRERMKTDAALTERMNRADDRLPTSRACVVCRTIMTPAGKRVFCSSACETAYRAARGRLTDDINALPRASDRGGLTALRLSKSLTQSQLAHAVGVDQSVVSRWECGKSPIPDAYKRALCAVLGCISLE